MRRWAPGGGLHGTARWQPGAWQPQSLLGLEIRLAWKAKSSVSESCSHLGEDSQRENLFHHAQRLGIGFDAVVGQFVRRQALVVEFSKAGLIAKQRTIGDVSGALQQV